jgi:stage V sporulation protein D (sporulation-specific penicillin-binding protein)
VILENLEGFSLKDAEKYLKNAGLSAIITGSGDTVTAQIPAAGEPVPGGSQVLLYLGVEPENRMVTVPDFSGMNRSGASDAAGALGLYILVTGNTDVAPNVVVTGQSIAPGTEVAAGTTITLHFTDTTARD